MVADEGYSVTGAVQKDAGTYAVTIALKNKENYAWSDDSDSDLTYSFVIEKAPNMVNGLILERPGSREKRLPCRLRRLPTAQLPISMQRLRRESIRQLFPLRSAPIR